MRSRLRALKLVAVAAAAATFGVMHAKASESGHLKRSFSSPPVASAQTTHLGPRGFTPRGAGQSEQVAKQVASARDSRGRRCGGALWRDPRQSEQVAKQVASARDSRGRRCGGSLWRDSRQSEQVAKQVASAQTTLRALNKASPRKHVIHRVPARRTASEPFRGAQRTRGKEIA